VDQAQPSDRDQVARILDALNAGTPGAEARLMELVHGELKRIAVVRLGGKIDGSISPTELVNDAYLKLFGNVNQHNWSGRGHFFGAAARAMRQILIDHARTKRRLKRGGNQLVLDLDLNLLPNLKQATSDDLLDLDQALETLAAEDPELVKLVELKFFGGQTTEQAAEHLEISLRTANRYWKYAKARLWQLMNAEQLNPPRQ
jgi:RNA polymerase sigma factor (TIGR02999 family)